MEDVKKDKKTFWQWLENLWYHYKWVLILSVIAILVAIYCIYAAVTAPKYDYTVAYIGHSSITLGQEDSLAETFKQYGEDLNNDGEVTVRVLAYDLNAYQYDSQKYMADVVNIQDDINNARSILYVIDPEAFDIYQNQFSCFGYFDGTHAADNVPIADVGWPWYATAFYQRLYFAGFPDNMYLVMRVVDGTAAEGNAKAQERFGEAKAMFDKIRQMNPHVDA